MLEAKVNKQEIKREREKRKRDEKLGREKKIENNRGKRTQLEILHLHHLLHIRWDKM